MIRALLLAGALLVLLALCVAGIGVQLTYRLPGRLTATVLPWIGAGLSAVTLVIIVTQLILDDGGLTRIRTALRRLEAFGAAAILPFCFYSTFVLLNGVLDHGAPHRVAAEVVRLDGMDIHVGPYTRVAWADLRSWRTATGTERVVVHPAEYRRLRGGQAVVVEIRPGYFGVPWVSRVTPDRERLLLTALEGAPAAAHALKGLLELQLAGHRWDDAIATARRYLETYPDDLGVVGRVAGSLNDAHRYHDTVRFLEPLAARRSHFQIDRALGFALARTGRQADGIRLLEQAIAAKPDDWWAPWALAHVYFRDKRCREALPWFERVLDLRPDFPEARDQLRECRAALGATS